MLVWYDVGDVDSDDDPPTPAAISVTNSLSAAVSVVSSLSVVGNGVSCQFRFFPVKNNDSKAPPQIVKFLFALDFISYRNSNSKTNSKLV